MDSVLWLDFETYSTVNIKNQGADIYCRHPSTEALILGWAIDDSPVYLWDCQSEFMPNDLRPFLLEKVGVIRAYNVSFDMSIAEHVLKIPIRISQWQDAQAMAYALSFAGSLSQVLGAVGLENKSLHGKALIDQFCKPQKVTRNQPIARHTQDTDPWSWHLFTEYCRQDVQVLRTLWTWCEQFSPMRSADWGLWELDREINQRGMPIDLTLVDASLEAMSRIKADLQQQLYDTTGLEKITPQPMQAFLGLPNFQKATKQAALLLETDPVKKKTLELSLQLAQVSSASKWAAFDRCTDKAAGVVRNTLQFLGASRTARWAGRGVQIHNMKWTTDNQQEDVDQIINGAPVTMEQISTNVRSAIRAPEGYKLIVSDLSSIESRIAAWLCDCSALQAVFDAGKDPYKDLASRLYNLPYSRVSKEQRTFAKPAALGAQYQLGAKGLVAYAEGFGVDLSEKEAKHQIQTYRSHYHEIPSFWGSIMQTIVHVVREIKLPDDVPQLKVNVHLRKLGKHKKFLCIDLPSGRSLHYYKPYFMKRAVPGFDNFIVDQFHFGGMINSQWYDASSTTKARDWDGVLLRGVSAHAGGILENIIQALARDILAEWLILANAHGLNIIGHVHDEIICLESDYDPQTALDLLNSLAAEPIDWAPGLNLSASGYIAERYKKD